jgi:hypothetical protein
LKSKGIDVVLGMD